MGDHLALYIDRLVTDSTSETATKWRKPTLVTVGSPSLYVPGTNSGNPSANGAAASADRKLVECRICQEEDSDATMEIPCSCRGSLKYAHRGCVQRWCDEKGDTVCEICLQPFKPGYTALRKNSPSRFRSLTANIGRWRVSEQNFHRARFTTIVPHDTDVVSDDEESSAARVRTIYCRLVAVIFMMLLLLRHVLPLLLTAEDAHYPLALPSVKRTVYNISGAAENCRSAFPDDSHGKNTCNISRPPSPSPSAAGDPRSFAIHSTVNCGFIRLVYPSEEDEVHHHPRQLAGDEDCQKKEKMKFV